MVFKMGTDKSTSQAKDSKKEYFKIMFLSYCRSNRLLHLIQNTNYLLRRPNQDNNLLNKSRIKIKKGITILWNLASGPEDILLKTMKDSIRNNKKYRQTRTMETLSSFSSLSLKSKINLTLQICKNIKLCCRKNIYLTIVESKNMWQYKEEILNLSLSRNREFYIPPFICTNFIIEPTLVLQVKKMFKVHILTQSANNIEKREALI